MGTLGPCSRRWSRKPRPAAVKQSSRHCSPKGSLTPQTPLLTMSHTQLSVHRVPCSWVGRLHLLCCLWPRMTSGDVQGVCRTRGKRQRQWRWRGGQPRRGYQWRGRRGWASTRGPRAPGPWHTLCCPLLHDNRWHHSHSQGPCCRYACAGGGCLWTPRVLQALTVSHASSRKLLTSLASPFCHVLLAPGP